MCVDVRAADQAAASGACQTVNDTADVLPFVSVVVPVRNEAAFIGDLVSSIFRQDYPADQMEVIVADEHVG